ncbi:hypothetical protein CH267_12745 [Rhodococcus sp. 06-621-2]|nr:hypothetical protein [Rhodococcus sp. 06-621-2]OZC55449.1 hypothetical protein CH267_12745 [Rhodococcus sp. 06-621-2]
MSTDYTAQHPISAQMREYIDDFLEAHQNAEGEAISWVLGHFGFLDWDTIFSLSVAQQHKIIDATHPTGWNGFVLEQSSRVFDAATLAFIEGGGVEFQSDSPLPEGPTPSDCWRALGLMAAPSSAAMAEARGWLADCGVDEDFLDELHDWQIARLVMRHYEGGWNAFVLAGGEFDPIVFPSEEANR